jgi:hypothetical protein
MKFIEHERRLSVYHIVRHCSLLPLTTLSITDESLQCGMWVYILLFVVILPSTVVGGPIPDTTFLIQGGIQRR